MPTKLPRRQPTVEAGKAWAPPLARLAFVLVAFFANSNFNERVLPGAMTTPLQQLIVIGLWTIVLFASFFQRERLQLDLKAVGTRIVLVFYAFAAISVLWSGEPVAGLLKSLALTLTTYGAYRLLATTPLDDVIESIVHGLFLLTGLSMALALLAPDIGVASAEHDYQHAGQWHGVFIAKQSLGIVAALQLFFVSYRLVIAPQGLIRGLYHGLALLIAFACEIGSGSRGGAAVAAAAILCVYLSKRSRRFAQALAYGPLAMCLFAIPPMIYLVRTGAQAFEIFGEEINFTDRVGIWEYALSHFPNAPWLGYGLNGFWTVKEIRDVFLEKHGWFLDNYHDGYIGVVMETGIVGMVLFMASYFFYGRRVKQDITEEGFVDADMAFTLVYTAMLFFLDFTETLFLRSTNMSATMLLMSYFVAFAHPVASAAEDALDSGSRRVTPRILTPRARRIEAAEARRRRRVDRI